MAGVKAKSEEHGWYKGKSVDKKADKASQKEPMHARHAREIGEMHARHLKEHGDMNKRHGAEHEALMARMAGADKAEAA